MIAPTKNSHVQAEAFASLVRTLQLGTYTHTCMCKPLRPASLTNWCVYIRASDWSQSVVTYGGHCTQRADNVPSVLVLAITIMFVPLPPPVPPSPSPRPRWTRLLWRGLAGCRRTRSSLRRTPSPVLAATPPSRKTVGSWSGE